MKNFDHSGLAPAPRTLLRYILVGILLMGALPAAFAGQPESEAAADEVAILDTNHGRMVIRFHEDHAPKTTAQIKSLIRDGFYDGKRFYRVVSGHVIQAGDGDGENGPNVPLEAGLEHIKGAVGLARGSDPDSGTTEIYICHDRRLHLDGKYAVFGQVIEGIDVLDRIAALPVDEQFVGDGVAFHQPKEPVVIEQAKLELRGPKK